MYYLLFGVFYLLSLLPFWLLYAFSDAVAWVMQHVIGYRRHIIRQNLQASFPNMDDQRKAQVTKAFYRNFCDIWIETIKLMTMSQAELSRRVQVDFEAFAQVQAIGRPATALIGHMFNWEYLNAVLGRCQPMPMLTVYMPVTNVAFDKLMYYIRQRFVLELVSVGELTQRIIPWRRKQYTLGLAADQSPAAPEAGWWMYFLNQPTAFVTGPERNADVLGQVPVFIKASKPRRGYYFFEAFVPNLPAEKKDRKRGDIIRAFAQFVEQEVTAHPELYLWSHKRWKHPWQAAYAPNWIDDKRPMPEAGKTSA